MTYHGGPVEHSSNVYAIFWTPAGYSFPSGYASLVSRYFTDVAHDSYTASNVYSVPTQYYNGSGASKKFESYNVALKACVVDTQAVSEERMQSSYALGDGSMSTGVPHRRPDPEEGEGGDRGEALPDRSRAPTTSCSRRKASRVARRPAVAGGRRLLQPAAVQRVLRVSTRTSGRVRSAVHLRATCRTPRSPVARRASRRTATRPTRCSTTSRTSTTSRCRIRSERLVRQRAAREIADKCHLTFGAPRGATATGQYNEFINGTPYWLQELWSNRAGGCVQRNTFPQPVTTLHVQADRRRRTGKKVTFPRR